MKTQASKNPQNYSMSTSTHSEKYIWQNALYVKWPNQSGHMYTAYKSFV